MCKLQFFEAYPKATMSMKRILQCFEAHLKATMRKKRSALSMSHTSGARHKLPKSSSLSSPLRLSADLQAVEMPERQHAIDV